MARWRWILTLSVAAFFAWAIGGHRFGLNDEVYFKWDWRSLPAWPMFGIALVLAIPFVVGQWLHRKCRATLIALTLMTLSTFCLMVGFSSNQSTPATLNRVAFVVQNKTDAGFFYQAVILANQGITARQLLAQYPRLLPSFTGHAINKPPGSILFCMLMMHWFGQDASAGITTGMIMGIFAALIVPATYLFIRRFTADREAAFIGASFVALCPAPILFFPLFDQCFPIFTAALTILWAAAIARDSWRLAALAGVIFGVATFFSYLPVVLGIFLVGYGLLEWLFPPPSVLQVRGKARGRRLGRIAFLGLAALAGFIWFYLLLRLTVGFHPIDAFLTSVHEEDIFMRDWVAAGNLRRELPGTIPWDLHGFALGSGWISYLLVILYFTRRPKSPGMAILCVSQFVLVALGGFVQSETARLWIFMLPMLMLPIGLELARWRFAPRLAVYAALLILTLVTWQNMIFLL